MRRTLLIGILICCSQLVTATTFDFNKECREHYQAIFNLQFQKAEKFIAAQKASQPVNAAVFYLEQQILFYKAFISEEDADFLKFRSEFDLRHDAYNSVPGGNPWAGYATSEMYLQSAILKLKRKEYLTAGYQLRKSYKIAVSNQEKFPSFIPNLKTLGFFHAVIGAVPDNYVWLANLAGMHGTIKQGASELTKLVEAAKNDNDLHFLLAESYFLRIFIASHFEKDPELAMKLTDEMVAQISDYGPLGAFIIANTCISKGLFDRALTTLQQVKATSQQYPLFYLDYLTGILKLNKLQLDAQKDFQRFLDGFQGNSFVKAAHQKIGWIDLLQKDTAGYRQALVVALKKGNDFTDEDKQAVKEAQTGIIPNIYLLRSRLYFDGGNYASSLTELAGAPAGSFNRLQDQLEYTYRLARIFDKKGQKTKALHYYGQTYENGSSTTYYFAANAALLSAIIYEEQKKNKEAIEWYKKCLALRNHEYQNSIDQKAEAGLNRLNAK
jgi:hypothetical protein